MLLFLSAYTYGQRYGAGRLNETSMSEMEMTHYDKDPEAGAVILSDKGDFYFEYRGSGIRLYMQRTTRIKIFNQSAYDYATVEIPIYNGSEGWEIISDIKGYTYRLENGSIVHTELDKKNIFRDEVDPDVNLVKFTLPEIKDGSVIEYQYVIETPYFFRMRRWDFQTKIPAMESSLVYRSVPFYEYVYLLMGTNKLDVLNSEVETQIRNLAGASYKETIWHMGMKHVPAYVDQDFTTSQRDHIISVNFQLANVYSVRMAKVRSIMTTWPELNKELLKGKYFGSYIKNSRKKGQEDLLQLGLDGKADIEKAKIITAHVKNKFEWDSHTAKYSTADASYLLQKKKGTSADINLYLIGLLQEAGLDAKPVVLSTREHGTVQKQYPFESFLNYVVAMVDIDGQQYFIDGTEPLLYFDELPLRCLNVEGLVVEQKKEDWVMTSQTQIAETTEAYKLKIDPEGGSANIDARLELVGNDAYTYRKIIAEGESLNKEEVLAKYLKEARNITVNNGVQITNLNELGQPLSFTFNTDAHVDVNEGKIFVNPFCNMHIKDNPFKQQERTIPIDLAYLRTRKYSVEIEIPKGYKVEYLPKAMDMDRTLFKIFYEAKEDNGKVKVDVEYSLKQNMYPAGQYGTLRTIMDAIINQMGEMVILVKE